MADTIRLLYFIFLCLFIRSAKGLKCRSNEISSQDRDLEEAVRKCAQQFSFRNVSGEPRQDGSLFTANTNWEGNSPKEHREHGGRPGGLISQIDMKRENQRKTDNKGNYREDPRKTEKDECSGKRERPWDSRKFSSGGNRSNRDGMQHQEDNYRDGPEDDFSSSSASDLSRRRQRPHSGSQQTQYDRDFVQSYSNHKQMFHNNPNYNNNQANRERRPNRDQSLIEGLDALDQQDRVSKQAILTKLAPRNMQDRELREFLQITVEDCFDATEEENQWAMKDGKKEENICNKTKSLAKCLEEHGKQVCDDWDDPMKGGKEREVNYNKNNNKMDDKKGPLSFNNGPNRGG